MARKAVQGYTEKSYFDNTRFLGLLATSDPLQEGYFRHLVNFDISDTNQSVKPRDGFLTTTLCKDVPNQTLISLSNKTIVYRDERIQKHILYDFSNHKGYIADISIYNLDNKRIPYTRDIGGYNWDNVIEFLLRESTTVKGDYDALVAAAYANVTFNYNNTYTLIAKSVDDYDAATIKWDCTISHFVLSPSYSIDDVWDLFLEECGESYDAWSEAYEAGGIIKLRLANGEFIFYQIGLISLDYDSIYADLLTIIKQNLTLIDVQLESAYDLNQVNKRLVRVNYKDEVQFWLQIYYRWDASTIAEKTFPSNTMIFEALDLHQHPTYDSNERNIANDHDLLPVTMQNVYTVDNRPVGTISKLNSFLFTKDVDNGTYHTNYIYPSLNYLIFPHFDLNPAVHDLNGSAENACHWAYRFDVTSTARANLLELNNDNEDITPTIYRSAWFKYNGLSSEPTPVFTFTTAPYDFTDSEPDNRHYNNARYVIFVVPNSVPSITVSTVAEAGILPDLEEPSNFSDAEARYSAWTATLSSIKNLPTLKAAIISMGQTARFKLTDLTDDTYYTSYTGVFGITFKHYESVSPNLDVTVDSAVLSDDDWQNRFLDADDLITLLGTTTAFREDSVVFKFLPYAVCETTTWGDGFPGIPLPTITRYHLRSLKDWTGHSEDIVLHKCSNIYQYNELYNFSNAVSGSTLIGANLTTLRETLPFLVTNKYFQNGYTLTFYLYPYDDADLASSTRLDKIHLQTMWDAISPYHVTQQWLFGYDALTVTKVVLKQPDDPKKIQEAEGYTTFDQNRLVVWHGADLYISQAGDLYYFKDASHKKFGEQIVKVIQYKNILLVFTVQHLYAVYEMDMEVATGRMNTDGTPITAIQTVWLSQTVLYNILTSKRYADAIKVFNQMVLFYSEDGQLFLIKPSTQIDDQTRFSLQYFNKSANDILQNYEVYMNERLAQYGTKHTLTKDDINIKVDATINFISIYYDAPGYMTYVLHYDVLNNRYFVYDTLSFHDIKQIYYAPGGSFLLTHYNNKSYFTLAYNEPLIADSQSDMAIYNNFQKLPIATLLDTGDMNLNNHLMKRFRDLYITFKNLGSRELMFRIETEIDDVVHVPFYATQLEVKDINGSPYFVTVVSPTEIDLLSFIDDVHSASDEVAAFSHVIRENVLSDQAFLLDVANYTSNKLITYRTSILGVGKVFRLKLQFISKGTYKIQQFGIIYKERRV